MILRQGELKDKKAILEIIGLLYLDIPGFIWNSEEFVVNQIKNKEYFIIEEKNNVVAIISLRKRKNRVSVETLAVKKEFQHNGFGSKLIEFAKQFTKDNGFKTLHAYSFVEYNAANFYLNRSFKLLNNSDYYNGHEYNCFEIKLN